MKSLSASKAGGIKTLKFQDSQSLSCDYFNTFQDGITFNCLGEVFVQFYATVHHSEQIHKPDNLFILEQ